MVNNKEKIFGIVIATLDYKGIYNQNKELFDQISKDFKKVYVVNLIRFKLREKLGKIKNQSLFPKNFIFLNFSNSSNFINFFNNKQMFAIQYLSKNPDYFKIFYLIKLANIKNIMIQNLGNFGNKQTPDFNLDHIFAFQHYYEKGFYYLFRLLTIINLFPKIDLLFESNINTIKAINNGFSRKFERLFPYFKISYFRKIKKVNSIFFEQIANYKTVTNKKKKYILYIDVPMDHGDKERREGKASHEEINKFYQNLSNFLDKISKLLKYNIVIGLHPSSKIGYKYLSRFKISKNKTLNLVPNSEIVIASHSSLISSAVIYNKKLLSIKSKYLGKYISCLAYKYETSLGLFSINIDQKMKIDKKNLLKKMNYSKKNYPHYIKSRLQADRNNKPNKKITETIKKEFLI